MLFEKEACIETTGLLISGLDARKVILTVVFETVRSLVEGRVLESSGKADAKFQSSSAGAPLLAWLLAGTAWACGGGAFVEAKLKSEAEGDGAGGWFCGIEGNGEG